MARQGRDGPAGADPDPARRGEAEQSCGHGRHPRRILHHGARGGRAMMIAAQLPRFSGFADQVFDAQVSFRAVMDAMANPGRVEKLAIAPDAPAGLAPALAAAALTLIDHDTPVFLDQAFAQDREIATSLSFYTGCRFIDDSSRALFALIGDPARCLDLARFGQGTLEYPDRSTTLLIQVEAVAGEG